ncbi:LysR family transcriptional regulator [Bacterioplanoides sp. SCSIO 12839]|uniref:LysR family transcriptional regulator n=1 Tax=Bacterioplanoides sp. SCSIO 12839 TaxID=2829569 RepID=UPI002104EA70|nr:LysR family transcriptional regulator [Bacterioplanoides sp. SCSIO 12839]UTW47800.1 LysR family transcriptional regulator [Bacterioplanoides sp. SCSIO 12839]
MTPIPQWAGIAEFVAVVESGSFTAAAERLQISTAQVSRQVNALEQRLGLQLLHRTTRKVTVTDTGKHYYQTCQRLLEGFESAEHELLEQQTQPKGKLRLTAPITYGERVLMPLLNDFLLLYPQMSLEVELSNTKLDITDAGFDLAIRLGQLQDSRLRARRLSSRQIYTCASPAYINRMGQPNTLSELKHHNCLVGSVSHWRFTEHTGSITQERNITVSGSLRCNSGISLVDSVLKGIGIAQLPAEYVSHHIAAGRLVTLLEHLQPKEEGIWGLYPASRWSSTKTSLLLDFLTERLEAASP